MSEETTPQATELQDVAVVIHGGKKLTTNQSLQNNQRLLPIGDAVSRWAIWNIESQTNNTGSTVNPDDAKNCTRFIAFLKREIARIKKYNTGRAGDLEFTHPIRFVSLIEIQKMANTPLRNLNYKLRSFFEILLTGDASKQQNFVDETTLTNIDSIFEEIEDYVQTEIGTGEQRGDAADGLFETGEDSPTTGAIGILAPTPLAGESFASEPGSQTPPRQPSDVTDR